ncbi:UDP-3-O-(3-hydroxymyristoyl)glucosamine N-acyltransferase [Aliikangiella sp. G2MR2-5]|uniref:UDP-3-O-(3-hydroxymyristoyl)glucosamine N-acyltransferase n=1 Tax=Aliikangiella sp. G2MR2-5 TaxID=2788943 RepID=UPI0018A9E763|nr:UDP-3-O-(3-hydroxymyristoyl)glucosamine N-acyltransferase [Aliikangiella sp. G2MR2-5]
MNSNSYTIKEIATSLDAKFKGDGEHEIKKVSSLDSAKSDEISFLNSAKFLKMLDTTHAGCVLLSEENACSYSGNVIVVKDPYLAFAKVGQLLDTTPTPEVGISESAVIHPTAKIGKSVSIAAGVVIEADTTIEDDVILGANVVVGEGSIIGKATRVYSNVSIYHGVSIGSDCIIHSGAVIGADGFGFANENGRWVKIPQTGGVTIGNFVEVGANACVDRGALNNTVVSDGVKLDNFCHIAHNVELGESVAMAAYTGVAGSSKIGEYTTLSGRTTILGHLELAPRTHVTACSVINKSIKEPGVYSSGTGMQDNKSWRKNVARFRQLDEMAKQIKSLEKRLSEISNSNDLKDE